jgi:hypothetical protein
VVERLREYLGNFGLSILSGTRPLSALNENDKAKVNDNFC